MTVANTAVALPNVAVTRPAFVADPRRRSFVKALRHQASLLTTLALLGSSTAYCVYALGSLAR